ncbi:hypothetical protein XIS1_1190011 [Xenorhabdus innexi]|uniref:Uncharacterized protein n=1 Tax=Xenorhabdus innexi TaxID=290109 RepID=A0A1N6MRQ7_9GAMM|nr:hypothetical protein XIS1_1190011 [Xenorhabdus innexi]
MLIDICGARLFHAKWPLTRELPIFIFPNHNLNFSEFSSFIIENPLSAQFGMKYFKGIW